MTKRSHYTHVPPAYQSVQVALQNNWLSRREVFEISTVPATTSDSPTHRANPSASIVAPRSPMKLLVVVFLGIMSLFPILCACLALVLLAPGMAQTRQLIASASQAQDEVARLSEPGVAISVTITPALASTRPISDPVTPLIDTLAQRSPTLAVKVTTSLSEKPNVAPVSPLRSPLVTPTGPSAKPSGVSTVGTATPFAAVGLTPGNRIVTPILPATFTAVPTRATDAGTVAPSPVATQNATQTATTNPADVVTMTVTPAPTLTPTPQGTPSIFISGSVVISAVMYSGTPQLNMSDQFIEVQNRGAYSVNISTWRIHAQHANLDFYFTNGLVLSAGQTCRIYSGSSPSGAGICGSFSFNSHIPVWSDTSDAAFLYDEKGQLVGSYAYNVPR